MGDYGITKLKPPPKLTKANRGWSNLRPARKGEPSRNPRGRPRKDFDLAAMAQAHAGAAIDTLVRCMSDEKASWSARISAAAEILDRGYGRAPLVDWIGTRNHLRGRI